MIDWRKLFLITYWIRKGEFNAFTFILDIYIWGFILTLITFLLIKIL